MSLTASMLRTSPVPRATPYPVHRIETTRLRDGTALTIRPISRCDLRLERAFVAALSPQTRYQRLLSGRKLQPGELRRLTDIDYGHELALVASATIGGRERLLGEARYVRDVTHGDGAESGIVAEFAIVIDDRWQGHGLGEMLLRRLVRAAAEEGIDVLSGITLSDNHRMIALGRKLEFRARRDPGYPSVTELRRELGDARAAPSHVVSAVEDALSWAAM